MRGAPDTMAYERSRTVDEALARFGAAVAARNPKPRPWLAYREDDDMTDTTDMVPIGETARAIVSGLDRSRFKTWTSGQKISEPGCYDIPLAIHHSNCCVGPSVSSSGLRLIEQKSLAHFFNQSYLNPNAEPFEPTEFMILGSAAHHLLLGQSHFAKHFAVRPATSGECGDPDDRPWNGNNRFCKKWLADQQKAGLEIVTDKMLEKIGGMAQRLGRVGLVRAGLMNGDVERSLIWPDPATGIWLKSRPDIIPVAGEAVADLKVVSDASLSATQWALRDYGLHVQLALARMGLEAVFGFPVSNDNCVLLFVENVAPFAVAPRLVDPRDIYYGRCLIRRALDKLSHALVRDEWPDYEDHFEQTLRLPKLDADHLNEQIEQGALPKPDGVPMPADVTVGGTRR